MTVLWAIFTLLAIMVGVLTAIYYRLQDMHDTLRSMSAQQRAQGADLAAMRIRSGVM